MFKKAVRYGLLVIAIVGWCRLRSSEASTKFPQSEYEALSDLYFDTDGENWTWKPSSGKVWSFTQLENPCDEKWQGIVCAFDATSNTSHVERILLGSYNLVGQLPDSIGNFSHLTNLVLKFNHLQGPVPKGLGNLSLLKILNMNHNLFSGPLPDTLSKLVNLTVFDFYVNGLTGTIPSYLETFRGLKYLDLYRNHFTGTIPSFIGNLTSLKFLYLGENEFTGSLPESLGNLVNLQYFYVNQCQLSGELPAQLAQLRSLVYFFVYSNYFSGTLSHVFNPAVQVNLSIVLVYENDFTGSLPDTLLRLPKLAALNAGSTCMHGSLPKYLCNSSTLQVLALDGLHTSPACRINILPGLDTYFLEPALSGGIPVCLFEVPSLTTLRLSSTGLIGTLPANVRLGPNFTDFGASHNFFTGPIPEVFQTHVWTYFDVSYNKLGGTLSSAMPPVAFGHFLDLRNNHLSGPIPASLVHSTGDLSILEGNLFDCALDHSDLPRNDPNVEKYQCGSKASDFAFYGLIVIFVLGACIAQATNPSLGMHWYEFKVFLVSIIMEHDTPEWMQGLPNYYKIYSTEKVFLRLCLALLPFFVMILLPLNVALSAWYGTLTYQYDYVTSLAFTEGPVALALSLVGIFGFFGYFYRAFLYFDGLNRVACDKFVAEHTALGEERSSDARQDSSVSGIIRNTYSTLREKGWIYIPLICLDLTIVAVVNIGYLQMVLYGNRADMVVAPYLLAGFRWALDPIRSYAVDRIALKMDEIHEDTKKGLLTAYAVVTLVGNFVIPYFVISFVSSACFRNVFYLGEKVESSFVYTECLDYGEGGCTASTEFVFSSSFHPPFVYNYQGAGTILSSYAPSFVISCMIQAVLMPALDWLLPMVLPYFGQSSNAYMLYHDFVVSPLKRPFPMNDAAPPRDASPFFNVRNHIVGLVNTLAIIVTFGVAFPPLAIAAILSMFSKVYFTRRNVRKFVQTARNKNIHQFVTRLDRDCVDVGTSVMLHRGMLVLLGMSSLFCLLFLFDMTGAYWVIAVMVFPAIVCIFVWLQVGIASDSPLDYLLQREDHGPDLESSFEMTDLSNIMKNMVTRPRTSTSRGDDNVELTPIGSRTDSTSGTTSRSASPSARDSTTASTPGSESSFSPLHYEDEDEVNCIQEVNYHLV